MVYSPLPHREGVGVGLMKKLLYIFLLGLACTALQSCLEYDEPGDELGFGQKLNPDTPTSEDTQE